MKHLPSIFNGISKVGKKTIHLFENSHAKGYIKVERPHPDVEILNAIAFKKKTHYKDLGPAMKAARQAGASVKNIAQAIGCSVSTVYHNTKNK